MAKTKQAGAAAQAKQASFNLAAPKSVDNIALTELYLDPDNPRFGLGGKKKNQTDILDLIVEQYGIEDVLSSIAVNGYFQAEPIICRERDGKLYVAEGNRRLAACLILAGDKRASKHPKRTASARELQERSHRQPFDAIPVITFKEGEQDKELLSYLGVRHIASSLPWDSYAKASWVAKAVAEGKMTPEEISMMTGDQHRTIVRLLHGYYIVQQLTETGRFVPEASYRKGRGSATEFPFSWVYTLFGYPTARKRLGISDIPMPNPIPEERLPDAQVCFQRMFGDSIAGIRPAIEDSRELGEFAAALGSEKWFQELRRGKTLLEIEAAFKPIKDQISDTLSNVQDLLKTLVGALEAQPPSAIEAATLLQDAVKVVNVAQAVRDRLLRAMTEDTTSGSL